MGQRARARVAAGIAWSGDLRTRGRGFGADRRRERVRVHRVVPRVLPARALATPSPARVHDIVSRHRTLMSLGDKIPAVHPSSFVAPSAAVVGDVKVGEGSSIWYGAVLRADVNSITIGKNSNIQDGTIIHVAKNNAKASLLPAIIGNNVTVGHKAVLHACTIEDSALVGMGATVLDGAVVRSGSMVAAGALVTSGTEVKSGQLWGGAPAKMMRELTAKEKAFLDTSAEAYTALAAGHKVEADKSFETLLEEADEREYLTTRDEQYDISLGVVNTSSKKEHPDLV